MPRPFSYNPPTDPPISIIHRDDDILVLDKPSGLLTVAGNHPHLSDCLEIRAQHEYPAARIIHRLDKDTSGVILLGMTAKSHADLSLQFEKRQTKKTYVARVWGRMAEKKGRVDQPIAVDWPNRPMQCIDPVHGREAITEWEVLGHEGDFTRVQLKPLTGRSHQLRIHLNHLGHPIVGDNLYAHERALAAGMRLELHAQVLEFTHPGTKETTSFEAACPF
jgi:tRNA pseudouridine32 synthase/23S rRNA pseudouridine746 synthase